MYNMDLLDTFQFSQTKYEICSDEETLKGKYCFETPILGKGNLKPLSRETGAPFQTGMLGPPSQNLYNGIYPLPRETLKIEPLLATRAYSHLHSMCPPTTTQSGAGGGGVQVTGVIILAK